MLKRMSKQNSKLQRPLDDFINIVFKSTPIIPNFKGIFIFFGFF